MFLGASIVEKGIAESMDTFELDMEKCERFVNSDICNGALQQADQKRGKFTRWKNGKDRSLIRQRNGENYDT